MDIHFALAATRRRDIEEMSFSVEGSVNIEFFKRAFWRCFAEADGTVMSLVVKLVNRSGH